MIRRHLVSIGCLVLVLSFTFEPFIQNLVHYRSIKVDDSSQVALLANTSIYKTHGKLLGGSRSFIYHFNMFPSFLTAKRRILP